jgi:hypothetical protein
MSANAGGTATADTLTFGGSVANLLHVSKGYDDVNSEQLSQTIKRLIAPPQVISGSNNIDWNLGTLFTQTLSANTTFTFSNTFPTETIIVFISNTSSNYTVTWPGTIKWVSSSVPIQTIGANTDVYTFINNGTVIVGSVVQNFNF